MPAFQAALEYSEVVSRQLKRFEARGWVALEQGTIDRSDTQPPRLSASIAIEAMRPRIL